MDKQPIEESPLLKLHHVGAIVKDVDKAAEYFESLGMGKFEPLVPDSKEDRVRGMVVDDLQLKVRMAHIGPLRIELIEPVAGKVSIWKEVLDSRGDCIHHLAFEVDDIEKAMAQLTKQGLKITNSHKWQSGGGAAYFENDNVKGIVFELFQPPGN